MGKTRLCCPRCGYTTDLLGNYKHHIARKKMCSPVVSTVVPSLDNVTKESIPTATNGGTKNGMSVQNMTNSTVSQNNQCTTINNHFHIAPPIQPFMLEDLSHITQEQWKVLAEKMASGEGHQAVLEMLSLIHFNPEKPENMNMYFPPQGGERVRLPQAAEGMMYKLDAGHVLFLSCRTRTWQVIARSTAAKWLAEEQANKLQNHVDDLRDDFPRETRKRIDAYVTERQAEDPSLLDVVDKLAAQGSRTVLHMHRNELAPHLIGSAKPIAPSKAR